MRALLLLLTWSIPLGLDRGLLAPPENPVTEEKIELGRRLFFERGLSADGTLACADCHRPELGSSDGRRVARGVGGREGTRNTPAIVNRTYGRSFFWDGRIRTLEEQVVQPIQNRAEMAADLAEVVARLRRDRRYRAGFERAFAAPPDARNLAYALASFVRVLLSGNSAYDRYEAGDRAALDGAAVEGLRLFRGRARCASCHSGSNLSDEEFHNTGVAWRSGAADLGRSGVTGRSEDRGKFKTPTLRDAALTAPYMHDGSLATLEQVVDHYDAGGGADPGRDPALRPLQLTSGEKGSLVAFLKALTGDRAPLERVFAARERR